MDILVRLSSLGGHLLVKIFLIIFFKTLDNFDKADVSNLDPRWTQRNGGRAQMGAHGRRRFSPHVHVCTTDG